MIDKFVEVCYQAEKNNKVFLDNIPAVIRGFKLDFPIVTDAQGRKVEVSRDLVIRQWEKNGKINIRS